MNAEKSLRSVTVRKVVNDTGHGSVVPVFVGLTRGECGLAESGTLHLPPGSNNIPFL